VAVHAELDVVAGPHPLPHSGVLFRVTLSRETIFLQQQPSFVRQHDDCECVAWSAAAAGTASSAARAQSEAYIRRTTRTGGSALIRRVIVSHSEHPLNRKACARSTGGAGFEVSEGSTAGPGPTEDT
jgi:hypothetical protein